MLAVVGAANSVEDVAAFTLLQRLIPDRILTRVFGVVWSLAMGGVAVGSVVAPALVEAFGPAAGVRRGGRDPAVAHAWRPTGELASIDRDAAPAPRVGVRPAGSHVSATFCRGQGTSGANLALQSVHAGEVVIRAGDRGDSFYMVGDGALEVTAEGLRTIADEGDYFGEIALLRDVPRTATVTALVDSRLYVLLRDDFLAAVTGHEAARAAGQTVVEERLSRTVGR